MISLMARAGWTRVAQRRWWCREVACPRKSFTEQIPQNPAASRLTGRLRSTAGRRVRDAGSTVVQAAHDLHLSCGPVEGRTVADVLGWLSTTPLSRRNRIRRVDIGMSATHRPAIRTGLPNAVVVVDTSTSCSSRTKCCP